MKPAILAGVMAAATAAVTTESVMFAVPAQPLAAHAMVAVGSLTGGLFVAIVPLLFYMAAPLLLRHA